MWVAQVYIKVHGSHLQKAFNTNNKRDVLQRVKEVIDSMRPVIKGKT